MSLSDEEHWKLVKAYCEPWRHELAQVQRNPADNQPWRMHVELFRDGIVITLSLGRKSLEAEVPYRKLPLDAEGGREVLRKRITRMFDGLSIPPPQLP